MNTSFKVHDHCCLSFIISFCCPALIILCIGVGFNLSRSQVVFFFILSLFSSVNKFVQLSVLF